MVTHAQLPEILTIAEAASYLRVSPWTLRHWISAGRLTYLKYLEGSVRMRRSDLDNFIQKDLRNQEVGSSSK